MGRTPDPEMATVKLVLVAIVAAQVLASFPNGALAQQRVWVAPETRPRPLTTRSMGVPASVQPVGRPGPAGPAFLPAPLYPLYWTAPVTAHPTRIGTRAVPMVAVAVVASGACAEVQVSTARGPWRTAVLLPALGADTPDALGAAIRQRIAAGRGVALTSVNGTRIRIPAEPDLGGVAVEPCRTPAGGR
jgi:hypothetical protein